MLGRLAPHDEVVAALLRRDESRAIAALQRIAALDAWDPPSLPPWQRTSGRALATAIVEDMPRLVTALLDRGVDHELRWDFNMTPLLLAVKSRTAAVVRLLLARGVRANQRDARGHTALAYAEHLGTADIAAMLRAAGGTSGAPRVGLLHRAVLRRRTAEVAKLLAQDVDVDEPGGKLPGEVLQFERRLTPLTS